VRKITIKLIYIILAGAVNFGICSTPWIPNNILYLILAMIFTALTLLPIYWVFRLIFVLASAIVVHNAWLYSYVLYEIKLRSSIVYPELGQDIYAFVLLGLLLIGSFHFSRDDNVTYFKSLK